MTDAVRFAEAADTVMAQERERASIGTLSEKNLHAILKLYFEPCTDCHERKVGRYVADIENPDGITEIQTRNFNLLRKKLDAFLMLGKVTVVYPIPRTKWLCWIDEESGEITKKRRSNKTGQAYDAVFELYKIKDRLHNPNLHLCFVMLELTEYRRLDGWSRDKKKGSSRFERTPDALLEEIRIDCEGDYEKLMPSSLPEKFTSHDFAKAAKRNLHLAQTALNILTEMGTVTRVGKEKNAYIYEITAKNPVSEPRKERKNGKG